MFKDFQRRDNKLQHIDDNFENSLSLFNTQIATCSIDRIKSFILYIDGYYLITYTVNNKTIEIYSKDHVANCNLASSIDDVEDNIHYQISVLEDVFQKVFIEVCYNENDADMRKAIYDGCNKYYVDVYARDIAAHNRNKFNYSTYELGMFLTNRRDIKLLLFVIYDDGGTLIKFIDQFGKVFHKYQNSYSYLNHLILSFFQLQLHDIQPCLLTLQ